MEISAKLVKQLRDQTGAGMMDCKRALVENNGDIEASAEYLRKKGLMDAAKKSSRTAADGLIAFELCDLKKCASIVELNSETDFVAKNEKFQSLANNIAKVVLNGSDDVNEIMSSKYIDSSNTVKEEIDSLISLIGENMTLRRAKKISVENGVIAAYMHNAVTSNLGKIGVLVALESETDQKDKLMEFGKKIAMHIAAANPSYLCEKCVPNDVIEKEKSIIIAQAQEMGKPQEIANKMAESKVKKFFEDVVLLDQFFVMDNKLRISEVVEQFSKEIGSPVKISTFVKFVLGEGIEKTESNFAEEVMSFVK